MAPLRFVSDAARLERLRLRVKREQRRHAQMDHVGHGSGIRIGRARLLVKSMTLRINAM